jgi:hypothetical protein
VFRQIVDRNRVEKNLREERKDEEASDRKGRGARI